jgi:hypothetical protein
MKRKQRNSPKQSRQSTSSARAAKKLGRSLSIESLEGRLMMAADFGDLPAPYPTTLAENGARHEAIGPQLGALRDTEANGVHSTAADADGADDDGVVFGALKVGKLGDTATVTLSGAPTGAKLSAWIDFDHDGSFGGLGEQVADNLVVNNGGNPLTFDIPATAIAGQTYARFRLSTAGNLGPKGAALDGEVEDYAVNVAAPTTGSGVFGLEQNVTKQGQSVQTAVAADVDGDGDMDLLYASFTDSEVAWLENNGSQAFTIHIIDNNAAGSGAHSVVAADIDGDGDMDVAASFDDQITWYENNGTQTFTAHAIATISAGHNIAVGDVDGDGDIDVVAATNARVMWFDNNGSQTFTQKLLPTTVGAGGNNGVTLVDVDRDGDEDILWASLSDNIGWFENNGSQTFTAHTIDAAATNARSVAAADMDGDGDLDLVAAIEGTNTFAWYENSGSQVFTKHAISTAYMGPQSVALGDINGDGKIDVVGCSATDNSVATFINQGAGMFTAGTVATTMKSPRSVFIADVNGDGKTDIVAASSGDSKVSWFQQQTGTGDFDHNNLVEGNDFLVWQRAAGGTAVPPGSGADGNSDGVVNGTDLAFWRSRFGTPASSAAVSSQSAAAVTAFAVGNSNAFVTANMFAEPEQSVQSELIEPVALPVLSASVTRDAAFSHLADDANADDASSTPPSADDSDWLRSLDESFYQTL